MRRRLDLAASLIAQPPLVFFDEPTPGLDPRTRAQMWETIRRLVHSGSSFVVTAARDLSNTGTAGIELVWALLGALAVVAVLAPLTVRAYMRKA